jgi:DNA recombination protein RmuC
MDGLGAVTIGTAAAVLGGILALLAVVLRLRHEVAEVARAQQADASALLLQQQIDGLRAQVGQALTGTTQLISQQLAHVGSAVGERLRENAEVIGQVQASLGERLDNAARVVGEVQRSLGSLEQATKQVHEVGRDIASLQEILRAPKLRGGLGELFLGELLAQILPAEYVSLQHAFRSGERVDAALRVGSGLVPVDAKFPLEDFRRLLEVETDEERTRARKAFAAQVKKHVDAIATKYILPDEGTYDFALMYIPAENVYYETIIRDERFGDERSISAYALERKVIPVSPNTFYAYLQAIVLGLNALRVEESAREIVQQLARLRGDLDRFREDYRKLGGHLTNALGSFTSGEKRLDRVQDKLADAVAGGTLPAAAASEDETAGGESLLFPAEGRRKTS